MNTQLVKTLAQIIKSLSEEERRLLEEQLQPQSEWETTKKRIIERRKAINQRLGDDPFNPSIDDIFYQMREERSKELIQNWFHNASQDKKNVQ